MKRFLLFSLIMAIGACGFAQQRATISKKQRNLAIERSPVIDETMNFSHEVLPSAKTYWPPEEETVGTTFFDLQSNSSMQNRVFVYDDGTIGAVWTIGYDFPNFTGDRGTGYNYFDGNAWGDAPTERIESDRCGWPAYSALGENGEINISHLSGGTEDGLKMLIRDEKGTGDWTESTFYGPDGNEGLVWPRMATGGINHSVIHLMSLTRPTANGGTIYEGLDGALLYTRWSNSGATLDIENVILDGLTSSEYTGFQGDSYEIQTQGDNVAMLIGESWVDLILMKSTDGGDNWEKTVIWENPYPMWNSTATDTFYTADGSHSLAFDQSGKVHVAFGINRALSVDGTAQSWFPGVGGIGYWNEDRPTFSNDVDALCPFSDCSYSELVDDYSIIGWTQDVNENGEIEILWDDIAIYQLGLSSMPQILIDDNNNIFVTYSSVTETYQTTTQSFRHLWARSSVDGGETWGEFLDLTSDLLHVFDECVFSSIASNSTDDDFYLAYQVDNEPGLAVRGDEDPYAENSIVFMNILKDDLIDGIEENQTLFDYDVLQNSPNPFAGTSTVQVNVRKASDLSLEVVNMIGQKVYTVDAGYAQPGMNEIVIDGTKLTSGVYFYTVRAGDTAITKKMIVE